jgi:hypothetical protein
VCEKGKQERSKVSALKGVLGDREAKRKQLRETVARQDDELAETRRRNTELGGCVQQLEKENRRLGESLKGQLARVEAGQQSAVTHLQEVIAAAGSKVNQDRANLEQELAKLKDEIKRVKMRAKQFPPSVKKGNSVDVPDGIIAHLTRECNGNVHDRQVVDITCGWFESVTIGTNPHSGAYCNYSGCAAKNAADLEADSCFQSALRGSEENIPHASNNWVCHDFKERIIVPTHYTIRTYWDDPGYSHLKSWRVETSGDGKN